MDEFKQYQLEQDDSARENVNPQGQDFSSSPNILATEKAINVGGRVNIDPNRGIEINSTNAPNKGTLLIRQTDPANNTPQAVTIEMEYGGVGMTLETTNDPQSTAFGPALNLIYSANQSATPVIGAIDFYALNSASVGRKYAAIQALVDDNTASAEFGELLLKVRTDGSTSPRSALGVTQGNISIYGGNVTVAAINATTVTNNRTFVLPDVSGTFAIVISGSGTAASFPAALGQIYIDTAAGNAYMATGTGSLESWKQIN